MTVDTAAWTTGGTVMSAGSGMDGYTITVQGWAAGLGGVVGRDTRENDRVREVIGTFSGEPTLGCAFVAVERIIRADRAGRAGRASGRFVLYRRGQRCAVWEGAPTLAAVYAAVYRGRWTARYPLTLGDFILREETA